MLHRLLTSSALAIATGACAQATVPPGAPATAMPLAVPIVKEAEGFLAGMIIGEAVCNRTGAATERISDFLGIGGNGVAIECVLLQIREDDGDEVLVVESTAEALKVRPVFERAAYQFLPVDAAVTESKPATAEDFVRTPMDVVFTGASASPEQAPAKAAPVDTVAPVSGGTSQ